MAQATALWNVMFSNKRHATKSVVSEYYQRIREKQSGLTIERDDSSEPRLPHYGNKVAADREQNKDHIDVQDQCCGSRNH